MALLLRGAWHCSSAEGGVQQAAAARPWMQGACASRPIRGCEQTKAHRRPSAGVGQGLRGAGAVLGRGDGAVVGAGIQQRPGGQMGAEPCEGGAARMQAGIGTLAAALVEVRLQLEALHTRASLDLGRKLAMLRRRKFTAQLLPASACGAGSACCNTRLLPRQAGHSLVRGEWASGFGPMPELAEFLQRAGIGQRLRCSVADLAAVPRPVTWTVARPVLRRQS